VIVASSPNDQKNIADEDTDGGSADKSKDNKDVESENK